MTIPIICATALLILSVIFFLGGREALGELFFKALPKDYLQKGETVYIYLNGLYNRKATVSNVGVCHVEIYDTLKLPLTFRGKFYGYGLEANGTQYVYLRDRHLHKWVRLAQLLAVLFAIIDDEDNLLPVTSEEVEAEMYENEGEDEL